MSRILLHLRGIGLTFGGRPILENAELSAGCKSGIFLMASPKVVFDPVTKQHMASTAEMDSLMEFR